MAMKEQYYTVDGQMIGYKTAAGRKDFLTDALGSVTAEVDQTGATKTFDGRYKPYGGDLSSTGTRGSYGWVGTWGYRGTGLSSSSHYVRARHYSKTSGKWPTIDPLWPSEDAYIYVDGMVLRAIDPSGRDFDLMEFLFNLIKPKPNPFKPTPCRGNDHPLLDFEMSDNYKWLRNVGKVKNFDYFSWEWGNCCGLNRKCGPRTNKKAQQSNGTCTDNACQDHDNCVGPWDIKRNLKVWTPCAEEFCYALSRCFSKNNCNSQISMSGECQASFEAGTAFCAIGGLKFPAKR